MSSQSRTTDASTRLRDAWTAELDAAEFARSTGDTTAEWTHRERAYILSQPMAGPQPFETNRRSRSAASSPYDVVVIGGGPVDVAFHAC